MANHCSSSIQVLPSKFCFHTSLLLDALSLLLRTPLAVLQLESCGTADLGSSQSCVPPELNRIQPGIQLSVISCCWQSSKVINLLARCCLLLGHPRASSGTYAVVQICKYHHQSGEQQASLKATLHCYTRWSTTRLTNFPCLLSDISG